MIFQKTASHFSGSCLPRAHVDRLDAVQTPDSRLCGQL